MHSIQVDLIRGINLSTVVMFSDANLNRAINLGYSHPQRSAMAPVAQVTLIATVFIYIVVVGNTTLAAIPSFWTKLAIVFIAYFAPISEMIHVMLIFLALDTISGIWASLKEGNSLQSSRLRTTVYKFLWYTVAVMAGWMLEHTFNMEFLHIAQITAGFVCFVELKSIFENITRITGDPVFRRVVKAIKKKSTETISEITADEEEPKKPEV